MKNEKRIPVKIIIDFDRTIYDTARRIFDTESLARKHGAPTPKWRAAWQAMYGHQYIGKGLYTIWDHAKRFGKLHRFDSQKFLRSYHDSVRKAVYVYPDTLRFLRAMKARGKLVLVSYGHKKFQELKIDHSRTKHFFDKVVIVNTYKAKKLPTILEKKTLNVFIDDNAHEIDEVKRNFPEVLTLHMRRGGRSSHPHSPNSSRLRDFEVKNLTQAYMIIDDAKQQFTHDVWTAVRLLSKGAAVVYPTDTVYGLGVDATNPRAVKKLFHIKGRSFKKPVHVIVSGLAMAKRYASFTPLAEKLFKRFMPGPLTLILDLRFKMRDSSGRPLPNPPHHLGRGKGGESASPGHGEKGREVGAFKLLSAGTGTIGIRMPNNRVALSLVKKLGRPITTTSANPDSGPTPYSALESFRQFKHRKYKPALYLDGGQLPERKPSTIVKLTGTKAEILRQGPISKQAILQNL